MKLKSSSSKSGHIRGGAIQTKAVAHSALKSTTDSFLNTLETPPSFD